MANEGEQVKEQMWIIKLLLLIMQEIWYMKNQFIALVTNPKCFDDYFYKIETAKRNLYHFKLIKYRYFS